MNWRSVIFKNFGAKIATMIMAIFLWFFVVTSREYSQVLNIPIELTELIDGKVIVNDPPKSAEVRFHGKGTSLLLLTLFGDAHLDLNLASINHFYDFPIRLEQVRWSSSIDVEILEILNPDTVRVELDEEVEATLHVQSMLVVTPAENYVITESVVLSPDTVISRGPKSYLEGLKIIPTQVKNIEKATGSINTKLSLIAPEGSKINLIPEEVRAFVRIEKLETRTMSSIPVRVIPATAGQSNFCEPSVIDVMIRGAQSRVEAIDRGQIIVSVSVEGNPSGSGIFTPVVIVPDSIELIEIRPDSVRINYVEADT